MVKNDNFGNPVKLNTSIEIAEFLELSGQFPMIDVRSPGEFQAGHIPGAFNVALFTNEERAIVGTAYKQKGREKAIEIAYDFVNPKRPFYLSEVEKVLSLTSTNSAAKTKTVLLHCWRGGMRSAGFAGFLNENGYTTYTLIRGYKAYRKHVLTSFGHDFNFVLLGGETGSGKTEILKKIGEKGRQIVDLEELAHHKGSAFGSLGESPQPSQEQFENDLSHNLLIAAKQGKVIWLEDESRSIGVRQLPTEIWNRMKASPIVRVKIPKERRIERLVEDYGKFRKEDLATCVRKIEKRLGPQHAKRALEELETGNLAAVADITLTYYDKAYNYNHEKRLFKDVFFVECDSADVMSNARNVLDFANSKLKSIYA